MVTQKQKRKTSKEKLLNPLNFSREQRIHSLKSVFRTHTNKTNIYISPSHFLGASVTYILVLFQNTVKAEV